MRELYDELLTLSDRRESLTTSVDGQADREAGSNFHDDLSLLDRRIAEIQAVLARAVPLDEGDRVPGEVAVGSRVTVRWAGDGDETYTIVDPIEASPRTGRISFESPVGQAVMGRRAGMTVTVMAVGGTSELEIVAVD
jgi:transcription elongation factor GreA